MHLIILCSFFTLQVANMCSPNRAPHHEPNEIGYGKLGYVGYYTWTALALLVISMFFT